MGVVSVVVDSGVGVPLRLVSAGVGLQGGGPIQTVLPFSKTVSSSSSCHFL
jgi:hypothetical protein